MKFYMNSVILALKNSMELSFLMPMIEMLQTVGIPVEAFLAEEELPDRQDALYITDCGKTARVLREKKLAVLGYQHGEEKLSEIDYIMERPEEIDVVYLDRVYRRYHRLPWDILETERCIIRESVVEDVDSFFEIYSYPEITRYTEELYPDKEQEMAYINEYIEKVYRYFEFGVWTVLWKETGEVIGRAGLSVREGYELPELGFVIGAPWQGKGVAYEICSAILKYGKEEFAFDKVQALVVPDNEASLALCRKLGFAEEKRVAENHKEYFLLIKEL